MKAFPLIALMTANAISMVGNVFALIAIPWFVLQTTHSPAKTGLTGFFITLAAVIAAFFGGAVVDRLGFKRMSIFADLCSAVSFALIPLLYTTIGLQYWQLLALVFAGNFFDAPGTTAREAIIPELAGAAGVSLERASALLQAVERGSRMVGAPLAGLLIALTGANNVIWYDAASFGVSALIVLLTIPGARPQPKTGQPPARYADDLKQGIRFILGDQLILVVTLAIIVTNFFDATMSGVIYPVYIQRYFGSAVDLGIIISASGGGALLSALIYGAVGHRLPRRAVFFWGFALVTLRFWIFPLVPPFWALVLVSLICGLASGPINPVISTVLYEKIPVQFRGRVLGSLTAIAFVAMPLGVLLGGLVLERVDIRLVLLVIGAIYLGTILIALFHPATREMNVKTQIPASVDLSTDG